jgi:hypothetical protein
MPAHSQVILTVLYPKVPKFDVSYFFSHHVPTTKAAWEPLGMVSCILTEVEDESDYLIKAIIGWKDLASWEKAKADDATKKLREDVKKFTEAPPVMIVGKIVTWSKG